MGPLDLAPYRIANPGRDLGRIRIDRDRAKVIAKAREMRRNMGMPPVPEWECGA